MLVPPLHRAERAREGVERFRKAAGVPRPGSREEGACAGRTLRSVQIRREPRGCGIGVRSGHGQQRCGHLHAAGQDGVRICGGLGVARRGQFIGVLRIRRCTRHPLQGVGSPLRVDLLFGVRQREGTGLLQAQETGPADDQCEKQRNEFRAHFPTILVGVPPCEADE